MDRDCGFFALLALAPMHLCWVLKEQVNLKRGVQLGLFKNMYIVSLEYEV